MRKIAFGYSTRCNLRCSHCVAAEENTTIAKMDIEVAKRSLVDLAAAGVTGVSFTAGEPFLYFEDLLELIGLCSSLKMYTRIVTNCSWANEKRHAAELLCQLKKQGANQLRLSFSRWHQQHVDRQNVVNVAEGCMKMGIDYFVSFITDFTEPDDTYENFLRSHALKFFPEPVIYAGRAESFGRSKLLTDFQKNQCAMNPYLAPDLSMYGCCDAGSHFTTTDFFYLGNLQESSAKELFAKHEKTPLFNCIRHIGISEIASFSGMKARDIVTYRKCDLCKKLFDNAESLQYLENAAEKKLAAWVR